MENQNEVKIGLREKIGYGFGDAASSMFWKLFGMYLMFFYTDVFGMEASLVGTMFFVTRIWDSFFDPVVGVLADRTNTRWGKFRPYILYLAIPFGIIGALTFFTPDISDSDKIIYAFVTYSLMMIIYSGINVPYASLLGVISPNVKDRNSLSTFRMAFAYIGGFVTFLFFQPMTSFFSKYSNNIKDIQHGWFMAVIVIAIACIILFFLCFLFTKERVKPVKAPSSFKTDLKDLWHNKPWWILLGAGISVLFFNSIRDGAVVYYFKYYVIEDMYGEVTFVTIPLALGGLFMALGQAANLLGVVISAPIRNRIGKRATFIAAMILAGILSIAFYWLDKEQVVAIFVFQIFISMCAGSIFPLLWSMYADCSDYSELKTGNKATGLIFSSSSMSQKIGWAIGSSLTGWLLGYYGFRANEVQSMEVIDGIKMFLSFFPAIGAVLSVAFISFYPLSEKKMINISEELQKRREDIK